MKVSSTPTILDQQLERKKILLEINGMKAEKEVVKRELEEYQAARDALKQEFKENVGIDDLKNAVLENIINNRLKYNIDKYEKDLQKLTMDMEVKESRLKGLAIELQQLDAELDEKTTKLKGVTEELAEKEEEHKQFVQKSTKEIEKIASYIKALKKEETELKIRNENYETEYLEKRAFISKEEIRLANKGSDLHIYEARLRKKYLELWPEMEIVI